MLGIDTTNWSVAGLFGTINQGIAGATSAATAILTAQGNLQALRNQNAQAKIATQSAALNNQLIQAQIAQIGAQSVAPQYIPQYMPAAVPAAMPAAVPSQNAVVQTQALTPSQSTVLALANQNAGMSPVMMGLLALGGLLVFRMAAK